MKYPKKNSFKTYLITSSNINLLFRPQGEKDLVYAELMLKPSDSDNPNKDATEYAEIVYVSPPAGAEAASQKAHSKTK